ncbi:MAG: hypothetical protein WBH98_08275 [Bacteroidales bacterium]
MKLKHIDNYSIAFVLGLLWLCNIVVLNRSKVFMYSFMIIPVLIIIIALYAYLFQSGEIVENNYSGIGYTKKEDGSCQPEVLKPYETRKGIDGVKTPYNTEKVFKICNGIKARITPTGKVEETTLLGKIANIGYTKKK